MKLIFVDDPHPVRGLGVAYTEQMLQAVKQGCGETMPLPQFMENRADYLAGKGYIPVLMLIGSNMGLELAKYCRDRNYPFVIVDHPHAGEQRYKMVRMTVNGIYPVYKEGAPIWENRSHDWDIQPWRCHQPRSILYCPSAPDFYGKGWLNLDETDEPNFKARLELAQIEQLINPAWHYHLRKRFENAWAEKHQGARPGADDAILASGAIAQGNSEILLKALRLGVPAFVDARPEFPLANTLASYAPLPLEVIDYPAIWQIAREPLFEQLAMSQGTLEEMADPVQFRKLLEWQFDHLID